MKLFKFLTGNFRLPEFIRIRLTTSGLKTIGFLFCSFGLLSLNGYTQDSGADFRTIDKETYRYYSNGYWDSLIYIGKDAIKGGTDYFYLRQRMGVAYFNKNNYMLSTMHFKQGLGFNSTDELTLEYLYYSYMMTNRSSDANALSSVFNNRLKEKLQIKNKPLFLFMYFEPGYTLSNNFAKNERQSFDEGGGKGNNGNGNPGRKILFGLQDLNGDKYFFHLGAGLNLTPKVQGYIGYGFLNTSKIKQIQISDLVVTGDTLIPWNGGYFVGNKYDTITEFYSDRYNLSQNEVYANVQMVLNQGFILTPAIHYLNIHFNSIFPGSYATDFYFQQIDTVPVRRIVYVVYKRDTSFNNFIASLSISKSISLFNLSLNGTWSNLNDGKQYQAGGSAVYLPKGNLDFYTTTILVATWQDAVNRFVYEQQAGVKVLKKFWLESFFTIGYLNNYNEKNAFVVFNSGDVIKFRAGANFIITLSEKIELSLHYRFTSEEGMRITFSDQGYTESNFNYQNNSIIGGIKWKL